MRDWRRSAAYRIAFTYSAAFALAIAVLGLIVYVAADAAFRHQQDAGIAAESAQLAAGYRSEGLAALRGAIAARESGTTPNAFGYALFAADGRRIAGALDTTVPPTIGWQQIGFVDPREGADSARALATALGNGRRLVIAVDDEALDRIDATILALFGGAFVLVLAIGVGGALVLGGYLRRRIERISLTAQAIVAGDLAQRVPVGGRGDEFDRLGGSLNAMLDRIAQLLDNLRQVSSDVAHDLRTPVARLRGGLEAALDGQDDPRAYRVALKNAIRQSDALLSLFASILRIAEVEGGALARSFARVDVSALVGDLCDSYAPAVSDGGRTLTCAVAPGIVVSGDRELVAQALINLLDNAQHHTPPGTTIAVALVRAGDRVRIVVADDGPGVAPADRPRIVQRFVRLEHSRQTPGHGLGLNLASAIAGAHGGTVTIDDNRPGLVVALTLPATAAGALSPA